MYVKGRRGQQHQAAYLSLHVPLSSISRWFPREYWDTAIICCFIAAMHTITKRGGKREGRETCALSADWSVFVKYINCFHKVVFWAYWEIRPIWILLFFILQSVYSIWSAVCVRPCVWERSEGDRTSNANNKPTNCHLIPDYTGGVFLSFQETRLMLFATIKNNCLVQVAWACVRPPDVYKSHHSQQHKLPSVIDHANCSAWHWQRPAHANFCHTRFLMQNMPKGNFVSRGEAHGVYSCKTCTGAFPPKVNCFELRQLGEMCKTKRH